MMSVLLFKLHRNKYLCPQLLFNFSFISIWLRFVVFARILLFFTDALCVRLVFITTDKHSKYALTSNKTAICSLIMMSMPNQS